MDASVRALVRRRAGNCCEYRLLRQEHLPFSIFQIEHIVARKHGGNDEPDNLALACGRCNSHKGANLTGVDPETILTAARADAGRLSTQVRHSLSGFSQRDSRRCYWPAYPYRPPVATASQITGLYRYRRAGNSARQRCHFCQTGIWARDFSCFLRLLAILMSAS